MVKLRFLFSSDILKFDNLLKVNEKEYILEDGASDIYIELPEKENCVEIEVTSKPYLIPQRTTNFLQRVVATLVIMLISGWSTEDIYDCDYNRCNTHLVLSLEGEFSVNVTINRKFSLKETIIECHTDDCRVTEQHNECDLDYDFVNMFFRDYQRFNCWRTGFLLAILFPLLIVGAIKHVVTTVVFSMLLLVFVFIGFFYTRRRLIHFHESVINNTNMK